MTGWAIASLACAAIPAALYFRNVRLYRPPPVETTPVAVSVLIPARNEEAGIEHCVRSVLVGTGVELEVIVLDDQSTDATADIVRRLAAEDPRIRLIDGKPLPAGWAGKQHACYTLVSHARHPVLAFLDADVRLEATALARLNAFREQTGADLVSGFPRQETGTIIEKLLIPLIHFVLLGFLPFDGMRWSRRPAFGAGCGQLFLTTADIYRTVGGHAHPTVRGSFHDGVKLPRAYRSIRLKTDLCDMTDLATCRMYRSAGQVCRGLAKNAHEGLGALPTLPFFTTVLGLGQLLPWTLVPSGNGFAVAACGLSIVVRMHAAGRFRQSWIGAALHPVGVLLLLVIQWYAFARWLVGRPVGWKGRTQPGLSSGT